MDLTVPVKHKLTIGTNVIIQNGASVINNLPDGDIVAGVPAKSIKHKVGVDKTTTNDRVT